LIISFNTIILVILAIGLSFLAGYAGIYACNNNNFLNNKINKRNINIISIIFIFWASLFFNETVAYAFGYFFYPFSIAVIHSCVRNKFKLKKIIDQKFCQFLFGTLTLSFILAWFPDPR